MFIGDGGFAIRHFHIEDLNIDTVSGGSHVFDFASDNTVVDWFSIDRVQWTNAVATASFFKCTRQPAHFTVQHSKFISQGASVSIFDIKNNADSYNMFALKFYDLMLNGSATNTAPLIDIEQNDTVLSVGLSLEHITFEIPGGGALKVRSMRHILLNNVITADLVTTPANPLIDIDKSSASGALPVQHVTVLNSQLLGGTAAYPDLKFGVATGQNKYIIIGSRIGYLDAQGFPTSSPIILASNIANYVGVTEPVNFNDAGQITGINQIYKSSTSNMNGAFSIDNTATSATVTLTAEDDTNYRIVVSPTDNVGAVADNCWRVKRVAKGTGNFTVTVEVAPGAGTTQNFEYHILR